MASCEPWYVTGLIELAGTFTFSRTDRNVVPYFALKLGSEDVEILEGIRAYLGGAGRIYTLGGRSRSAEADDAFPLAHYFRVTRIDDLDRIVSHFDHYPLRGRKAESYAIWRELVEIKRAAYRRPDRGRIDSLCASLSAARRRTPTR